LLQEITISSEKIFNGKLLNLRIDKVLLPDKRESFREIVEHPGAVSVVPLNNEDIYLVKQYRKPVEEALLEIPAGTLEPGEDPLQCAHRELAEETGFKAGKIEKITTFYTSPGICTEIMHLYLASDLTDTEGQTDNDEFIKIEKYNYKDLNNLIIEGKIKDAKSIIGIVLAEKVLKNNK